MRRVRERGSVCLYVAVILLSLALLTSAVVPLSTAYRTRTTRRTDELRARLAFEAGVAQMKSQGLTMSWTLGTSYPISVSGASGNVVLAANDAQLPKSLLATGSITRNGRVYRYSRVIGSRIPTPFSFALLTNSKFDMNAKIVTGASGADGDVCAIDKFNFNVANDTINGNVVAQKAITPRGDTTITGRQYPNYADVSFPDVNSSDYLAEATSGVPLGLSTIYVLPASLPSLSFAAPISGTYPIVYCSGNLSLSGTITGRGTIYVAGNLKITGNISYANSSSLAAIIVNGTITVVSSVSTVNGILYTDSSFTSQSASLTIPRGMIVAKSIASDLPLTITRDNVARDDSDEATRLRLPYYWP